MMRGLCLAIPQRVRDDARVTLFRLVHEDACEDFLETEIQEAGYETQKP
jgi:hypothetical protein